MLHQNLNSFFLLTLLFFCLQTSSQEFTFYELEDYEATLNESFCVDLILSDTILVDEFSHAFYWEAENLRFESARIISNSIPEDHVRIWETSNYRKYRYIHLNRICNIEDTVLILPGPQLRMCFTALNEGRHIIDYWENHLIDYRSEEVVHFKESLINVGDQPKGHIKIDALFSDPIVQEDRKFTLDPIPLSHVPHLIDYEFDLICDKNFILIDFEQLAGGNIPRFLTISDENYGYHLSWKYPFSTSFFYNTDDFEIPMKTNNVSQDTTIRIHIENFSLTNSTEDDIHFFSDTSRIRIVSQINQDESVRLEGEIKHALKYASTPIAFRVKNFRDIESFKLSVFLSDSILLDSIHVNPSIENQTTYTHSTHQNSISFDFNTQGGNGLDLPDEDTLFTLFANANEYYGYRYLRIQGMEFKQDNGNFLFTSKRDGELSTYTTEKDQLIIFSDFHEVETGSNINMDVRLISSDINLMKDFRFDYSWDHNVLKYRNHTINNELYDFENASVIGPNDIGGSEHLIKVNWNPDDRPDTLVQPGIDTLSLMQAEFEVIGQPGDYTGLSLLDAHVNSIDTSYRGVLQFQVGYGYLRIKEQFDTILCSIDSLRLGSDDKLYAGIYAENLKKAESLVLKVDFDTSFFEYLTYVDHISAGNPSIIRFTEPDHSDNSFGIRLWSPSSGFSYCVKKHICDLVFDLKSNADDCGSITFDEDNSSIFHTSFTNGHLDFKNAQYCITNTEEDKIEASPEIFLFPTLTSDGFNIKNPQLGLDYSVSIYNTHGKLLKQILNSPNHVSTQNLSAGIYYVQIVSEHSKIVEKIIITRH